MNDGDVQQQIRAQSPSAVEQTKAGTSNLYIQTAETQMNRYQQQYNEQLEKIFKGRKSLPIDQQLTSGMFDLLEQRADNREERIKCVTQYKIRCLHSNSNQE